MNCADGGASDEGMAGGSACWREGVVTGRLMVMVLKMCVGVVGGFGGVLLVELAMIVKCGGGCLFVVVVCLWRSEGERFFGGKETYWLNRVRSRYDGTEVEFCTAPVVRFVPCVYHGTSVHCGSERNEKVESKGIFPANVASVGPEE